MASTPACFSMRAASIPACVSKSRRPAFSISRAASLRLLGAASGMRGGILAAIGSPFCLDMLAQRGCLLLADIVEKLICCGGGLLLIHSTENESGGSVDDWRSAGDAGELVLSVSVGRPHSHQSHAACHRPLRRSRWVEAASGAVL